MGANAPTPKQNISANSHASNSPSAQLKVDAFLSEPIHFHRGSIVSSKIIGDQAAV
jgi:hypothetical protein